MIATLPHAASALARRLVGVALLTAVVLGAPARAAASGGASTSVVSLPPYTEVAGLVVGADGVWAVNPLAGSVLRIDPRTNQVVATISVAAPSRACGRCWGAVAAVDDAVWVAMDLAGSVVVRIDPTSNEVVETVAVGVLPTAVALGEDGALWLVATPENAVMRVDPQLPRVVSPTAVHLPAGISVGRDGVWVTAWGKPGANGQVVRLDPHTGVVLATIPVGRDPGALAVADADVWVANELDDTLSRIDARSNRVAATLPVAHDPVGVAVGSDAVWVVSRGAAPLSPPTLARIDPSRNTVAETLPLDGTAPIGMAAGAGSLWVASRNLGEVVRIGPLPLPATASAAGDPPLVPIALGAGIMLVLMAGEVLRRSAQSGGDRPVPDGRLLSALLINSSPAARKHERLTMTERAARVEKA